MWKSTHSVDCSCGRVVHDDDTGASVKHSLGQIGADVGRASSDASQVGLPVGVWGGIQPAHAPQAFSMPIVSEEADITLS